MVLAEYSFEQYKVEIKVSYTFTMST